MSLSRSHSARPLAWSLVIAALALAGVASAQAPAPLSDTRFQDPNVDRTVIFPSAETQPRGTAYFTAYDLVLLRGGYAVTDSLQLSAAALVPLRDGPNSIASFGDASVKARLLRTPWARVAATAGYAAASRAFESPNGYHHLRVGGVATLCLEATCSVRISPGLHGLFPTVSDNDDVLIGTVGAVIHVSQSVALLAEPSYFFWFTEGREDQGTLLGYGLRFHGERVAFDLTFARPLVEGGGDFFPLGLPLFALTVRGLGDQARAARSSRRERPGRPALPAAPPPGPDDSGFGESTRRW